MHLSGLFDLKLHQIAGAIDPVAAPVHGKRVHGTELASRIAANGVQSTLAQGFARNCSACQTRILPYLTRRT